MEGIQERYQERTTPDIISGILARRGMTPSEIEDFLNPDYERDLNDPYLMLDMDVAVARLAQAARNDERVAVYGDYDIDGITASAVLLEAFAHFGITAESYIPDRFEEGYGLNTTALEYLKTKGYDLVVSVDCGITSVKEAAWAREHGLDLIITDHHAVPEVLPGAIAVINPKRPGDPYPFKHLAGVGVAFKLVQALQGRLEGLPDGQEKWLLDLVALGSVCDVVELLGENRVLVAYGLKVMRQTRRPGLRALAAVGGVNITEICSENLGFVLGPRMNAAGRLEHAARSLELMVTQDHARAREIAEELDGLNTRRRADQARIFSEADAQAAEREADPVLVLADPGWSHGIVGIVASKLVEKWHKPVVVMQVMGETTKGSARSVPSFNMVEGLRRVQHHLIKFGGHFYAAGATLPTASLDAFRHDLIAAFNEAGGVMGEEQELPIEARLEDLAQANWPLQQALALLEPFGAANPKPVLGVDGLTVLDVRRIGADRRHLKLRLGDARSSMDAVGFGLAERYPDLKTGDRLTAAFRLERNEWQGRVSLQMNLCEVRDV